ncbi:MAG: protein kinase [Polyangiaceae bacterium]
MDCLACHAKNADGARFCASCGAPLPASPTANADPLLGRVIDNRYRITSVLGEGGMGRVYVAERQMGSDVRRFAVKTLLTQFAKDPQTVARFMREIGTVSGLEHPNTVKISDWGRIDGTGEIYIAMELLQGKPLENAIANGTALAPERVDKIVAQVCGSLQEAHDKGIVHRDLKPANIYLTTRAGEDDYVKVLDFGIAKRSSQDTKADEKLTQQGTVLGTPPYMSPEQFTGKELDARSDIYSLGVVTYEMLTGHLPFEAESPWDWMTKHMTEPPRSFDTTPAGRNVPPKMRNAVLRALSKDKNQRQQSARDFFEELTIGATRMTAVGLGIGGVAAMPGVVSGPAPVGPGRTQMGTPIESALAPQATAKTLPGDAPWVPQPTVPTAGGQAIPAQPQPQKKGGGGALIATVAVLFVVGGAVGAFFFLRNKKKPDDNDTTVAISTATATSDKSEVSATPSATTATASATTTSSTAATETTRPLPSAVKTTTSARPTTSVTPSASASTSAKPVAGIDACCARQKGSKRTLCDRMNAGIKSGKLNRDAALANLAANGVTCR